MSDFLFATPKFISGMGAVLDLGSTIAMFNESSTLEETDTFALANDWSMVGKDALCSVLVFDSMSKPTTRQTKSDVALVATSSQSLVYSGSLPPASEMDKYEKICPGATDRILKMAEQQAKYRQNIEAIAVKTSSERSFLGVKYAFT